MAKLVTMPTRYLKVSGSNPEQGKIFFSVGPEFLEFILDEALLSFMATL
jgi:hypothetical protein